MTIKQQGGIFGRNPTFNDLTVSGAFTSKGIDDNATSTAVTVDSNGKVGIGLTDQNYDLSVGGASGGHYIQVRSDDSSSTIGLLFSDALAGNKGAIFYDQSAEDMYFRANNSERLRIRAQGGITFNGDTAAANALDDYEEGTWTPNQGAGLTVIGSFTSSGTYTKIGRQVTINGRVNGSTSISAALGSVICTNLPFVTGGDFMGVAVWNSAQTSSSFFAQTSTIYAVEQITASPSIYFTITYFV